MEFGKVPNCKDDLIIKCCCLLYKYVHETTLLSELATRNMADKMVTKSWSSVL